MQAFKARALCLRAAVSLLAPGNCFTMYRMASSCTLLGLQQASLKTALQNFTTAVTEDSLAFCALTFSQMLLLTQDSSLVVSFCATS